MDMSAALDEYLLAKDDLSPSTKRWYTQKLRALVAWCAAEGVTDLGQLSATHVHRYLATLREHPSTQFGRPITSHTLKGYARIIKTFLVWCAEDELLPARVAHRIQMPRVEQRVIKTFTPAHLRALFDACADPDQPDLAARDRAILAVLLDTGVRANELCTLTLDHTFLSTEDSFLRVFGKGRKEREVGLGKQARTHLHRYIHRYRHGPRDEPHVFLRRGGRPLKPEGLDRMLYRLRDRAGVEGVRVSAHTFRHTFACSYLADGGDLFKLSRLLGHTSVSITETYLRDFQQRDARRDRRSVLDNL